MEHKLTISGNSQYSFAAGEYSFIHGGICCVSWGRFICIPDPHPGETHIRVHFEVEELEAPTGNIRYEARLAKGLAGEGIQPPLYGRGPTAETALLDAQAKFFAHLSQQRSEMLQVASADQKRVEAGVRAGVQTDQDFDEEP